MQAYILRTGRSIAPFDRPVGQVKVHNRPLGTVQEDILTALGCTCEPIDDLEHVRAFPCVVVADDLYFTRAAMHGFLRAARRRGGCQAALATSELTERFATAFQGAEVEGPGGTPCRSYDCFHLEGFDPAQPLEAQTKLLPIPYRCVRLRARVNRYFEPSGRFVLPISPVFMVPIRHWAGLLAANVVGMTGHVLDALRRRPLAAAALPLALLLRAGSLRPSRLLGKLYLAGRGCRVHPDAHVEGALLGRRVRIGPGAVVRGCIVGDYAEIGPCAVVEGCTLGDEVIVNANVLVRCCTADAGAGLGALFTQFSVLGAGAVLCPKSGIFDFRFHGDIHVTSDGRTVPSGSRLLGACLGDRAFLGPDVRLLAGQELPNDCILVPNPRTAVRGLQHDLPDNVVRLRARRHPT